jgi:hypothetical protein
MRNRMNHSSILAAALMVAAAAAPAMGDVFPPPRRRRIQVTPPEPSNKAAILEWNQAVDKRKAERTALRNARALKDEQHG